MLNSRKKIVSKLREGVVSPEDFKKNTEDLVKTAKDALGLDNDDAAKDYVSGFIGEELGTPSIDIQGRVGEIIKTLKNNGIEVNVENIILGSLFSTGGTLAGYENEVNDIINKSSIGESESEGEKPFNPEVEADKYAEYRALMAQLAAEEGGKEIPVKEDDIMSQEPQPTNDPVKLKADVEKLMAKLDISSIAPYLAKIDNPVEQAEVIGQFAEKIGVPKAKLSSVVAQLKNIAESDTVKMTKDKLIEAVSGRKIIKTIKVKDIK